MNPHAASATRIAALVAAIACAMPGTAWSRASDRNQPMDIDANASDCAAEGPCVFTGNVVIVQGTLKINAAKADVRQGDGDIQRVLLTGGPVRMEQQLDSGSTVTARASNVDYSMPTDTVVFTGDVVLDQPGRGTMRGARVVYNMRTGQVQGGGGENGQIRTTILPRGAREGAPAAPAATPPATTPPATPPGDGN